jgi:Protein of unknown function (DUF1302)
MYISRSPPQTRRRALLRQALLCSLLPAWLAGGAQAASLYAGDGLELRWDNTIRYTSAARLADRNSTLLAYSNSDDGDSNFAPGLISNRLDLVSVLDLTGEEFGAQASLYAWYDSVYHAHTDDKTPATYNPYSPNSQFPRATRNLEGQYADLGDTFAYGNFIAAGMPVSFRIGRQTLLWGESLFFGQNGIAAGMAPVDYIKSIGTPDGYSKDVFLPVDQLSLTLQPRADLSFAAYYQLEGRASRLPGVGSYFSDTDVQGAGAGRAFLTNAEYLVHDADQRPRSDGQFGASLHATLDEFDLGLYALRYNDKYPVLTVDYSVAPSPSGYAGKFHSFYPTGIDIYGASFSTYVEGSNIAGEISARRNMPLVSISPVSLYFTTPLISVGEKGYAEGDTLHAQLSSVTTLSRGALWDSADLDAEIAANDLLAVTQDPGDLAPNRTRMAASFRGLFKPHYFQVLPNLDASLVMGLGYNLGGRSSTDYTQNFGAGDFELGVSATWMSAWKADLTLTSFMGAPARQLLADRDFLSFSIERTF